MASGVFPANTLMLTVKVPPHPVQKPPPFVAALLANTWQATTTAVPSFQMPPPCSA